MFVVYLTKGNSGKANPKSTLGFLPCEDDRHTQLHVLISVSDRRGVSPVRPRRVSPR